MMKKFFTLLALVAISISSMAQWLPQASGFATPSRGIKYMHAVSDQIVWATAYDGSTTAAVIQEFTKTVNGGDLWTPGTINGTVGMEPGMIYAIDGNTAYVPMYRMSGSIPQGIYVTTNGGTTWSRQTTAAFSNSVSFPNIVHFFDANNGWCQGDPINGDFEMYTTSNGGTTWTLVPGDNIPAPVSGEFGVVGYYSAIGDNVWFGTNKGRVYRSSDKGITWDVSATSLPVTYVDVKFASVTHGISMDKGASSTGAMSETFDGGITWADVLVTGTVLTNDYAYVPGTPNTWVCTGAADGATGIAYSYDGCHTWAFFPDTQEIQFLATDWINSTTGWCGAFNESNTVGGMYKFNGALEEPLPPTNFQGTVSGGNDVNLTWDAPSGSRELLGYNVWRNGAKIANQISDTFYDDMDLANGGYSYLVTAVYDNGESVPAGPVEIEITGSGNLTSIILDFEDQADFDLTFGEWEAVDLDGGATYGFSGITFPHSGEPMAFIAFNPLATTPPVDEMTTHGGERMGACFATIPASAPNNDWLISPQVNLGTNAMISMWVKTFDPLYIETYNILVSTTDNDPASFTLLAGPVTAPATAWTYVEYDLTDYEGQAVYVAIQCVSNDKFIFLIDDITISFFTSTGDLPMAESLKVYPNPVNDVLNIQAGVEITNARLFNIAGQMVYQSNGTSNEMRISTSEMPSGLYLLNITTKQGTITRKVSIR